MYRVILPGKLILHAPLLLAMMMASQLTQAACAASASTTPALMDYGAVASQNVPAGNISPNGTAVDGNFSVTCGVSLSLNLLNTSSWVRYSPQVALNLSNGSDTIPYAIGSNSTFTPSVTAVGQSVGGSSGFNLLSLGVLTAGQVNIPLHVKTLATTFWPSAGTYIANQTLTVDGFMCTGIGLPGVCLGLDPINSSVTMSMKLIVSKSCEFVSSPTLVDFGSVGFLENATTMQLATSIRCTRLEDYLLYVDNGNNYASGSRRMVNANTQSVRYEILQPGSTTLPLGITTPLSRLGTGLVEPLNIPVRITASQSTPPAGVYTDNVRVVLEY